MFLDFLAIYSNRMERISAGTTLATGFILGQGILASFWLLLALVGWLSFYTVALVAITLALVGLYTGRNLLVTFGSQIASIWHELRKDTWGWQMMSGLTVILWLSWATSLGRPLAWDGTVFYFALGKLIAFSQYLTPLPGYEEFTSIGLLGEMHFAALMVLHSPECGQDCLPGLSLL